MKHYIYIISDKEKRNLHVGLCSDLKKTVQFYEQLPTLFFDPKQQLNTLLYFERFNDEDQAMTRFKFLSKFTVPQKEKLITAFNKEFKDIRNQI